MRQESRRERIKTAVLLVLYENIQSLKLSIEQRHELARQVADRLEGVL